MRIFGVFSILLLAISGAQASTVIDLTTANASDNTHSGATGGQFQVTQIQPSSTGTGVIDSFLRVHSNDSLEQGYNTSLSTPLDDVGGNFTRTLALSEIPIVNIGGTLYRQFLLDVNQEGGASKISLNQIQIFQLAGDRDDGTVAGPAAGSASVVSFAGTPTTTEVFRLNNASNANFLEIQLDAGLNSGSGSGDMFLYVRNSDFVPANGANVILYSAFGIQPGSTGTGNNDGFEEWAVVKASGTQCIGDCTVNVPEISSVSLLGTSALLLLIPLRRRFGRRQA